MIGTDETRTAAAAVGADLRAAMPAGIVKSPNRLIVPSNQDDRIAADGEREITSRRRQLRLERHEQPGIREHFGHVEREHIRIGVERLRQGVIRLAAAGQLPDPLAIVHGADLHADSNRQPP